MERKAIKKKVTTTLNKGKKEGRKEEQKEGRK